MVTQLLLVAAGGAAGSILRFLTSALMIRLLPGSFIIGTLTANLLGCFLIGLLMGWLVPEDQSRQSLRLLLVTGFCGGYTTFSAFSYENIRLIGTNQSGLAVGYIFASVAGGILAVWAGLKLVHA